MRILTLTTPDIENGEGCRVTLWFAGCSHKCPGCHNTHTWDYNQGSYLDNNEVRNKIYEEVNHHYISGITLSGGDPLDQPDKNLEILLDFVIRFKRDFPDKTIWVYSGGIYEKMIENELIEDILKYCDVLIDGPFIKELYDPDLAFRGSSNQRIIRLK